MKPDPYVVLRTLTFDDWDEWRAKLADDKSPKAALLIPILEHLATTTPEWLNVSVYYECNGKPGKAAEALKNAVRSARGYWDWFEIAWNTGGELQARAVAELERRSRTYEQVQRLSSCLVSTHNAHRDVRRRLFTRLLSRVTTFQQLLEILGDAEDFDPGTRDEIRRRVEEAATTPEDQEAIRRHDWTMATTKRLAAEARARMEHERQQETRRAE